MTGFIALCVLASVVSMALASSNEQRVHADLEAFAARFFQGRHGQLSGMFRGRHVTFSDGLTASRHGASARLPHVQVAPPWPHPAQCAAVHLAIEPRGVSRALGDAGAHRIVLGDAAFDAAFRVSGAPAETVRAIVTPALRARIVAAYREGLRGRLFFEDGCVGYVDHSLWGAAPVALLPSATLLCCDLLDAVIAVACPPTPHATA